MKELKISLVVIVVVAIIAGIFFWIQNIKEPEKVKASENQFIAKIMLEIEELKVKPESSFCKDFYNKVAYHINEYYKPLPPNYPYGRFGKTESENDQWKEYLEKNLYATYAEKFIVQAKAFFRGSEWRLDELRFIQDEKNELKNSRFLTVGSPVYKEFTTIQNVLDKYNEIESFITSCNGFSYSNTALSDHFPITEVQSNISRAASLLRNHLENEFVNNCTRLHNGLEEIPQKLFKKHVQYLDNKINNWSEMYPNYNSHSDYSNLLNQPLKAEIETLDNNLYKVSYFESEYNRLLQKWSEDNIKAYKHKY